MNIVVCMKYMNSMPEYRSSRLPFSPAEIDALGMALQVKRKQEQAAVTVVTMGPMAALRAMQDLYSYGVDQIYLCSDRRYAGSDTLATVYVLAKAIQKLSRKAPVQLILCGQNTIDSNTGQVGPGLAYRLGGEFYESLQRIDIQDGAITFVTERFIIRQPNCLVLATVSQKCPLPFPAMKDIRSSQHKSIVVWDNGNLKIKEELVGLAGSPTKIVKTDVKYPAVKERVTVTGTLTEKTDFLKDLMKSKGYHYE